jgi:hypothetical protein
MDENKQGKDERAFCKMVVCLTVELDSKIIFVVAVIVC